VLAALLLPLLAPQDAVDVAVRNRAGLARSETVRFALPFAPGELGTLGAVRVDGAPAAAVALLRWRDGSLALAQVHARATLAAGEERRLAVVVHADGAALAGPPPPALPLALRTEVEDPWGRVWVARPRVAAEVEAGSSALLAIRRVSGLHQRDGAALLPLSGFLITFAGERRAELTLILDNARLPGQPVLGPVRLRAFRLVTETPELRVRPRFAAHDALRPPVAQDDGFRQDLLGPSDHLYLGDATGKAFRFDVFVDGPQVGEAERDSARAAARAPLAAFASLDRVRASRAFAAHGGPAPLGSDFARDQLDLWRRGTGFGPFGGRGDPPDAAAQGMPRNGASALHNAVRWSSTELLEAAESMVLQQCLRPPPAHRPRLPADTERWRRGLSERSVQRPHGFTSLDYEHFSVDLLYDYWWLTGDPLAREELARAGRGLPKLLAGLPFLTARGEGWCLQAGVLIARATGDRGLLDALHERFVTAVLPALGRPPQGWALRQPPHADAFGDNVPFDAPWQMAALVHGLHALFVETGDARVREAAVRTAEIMATAGWIEGEGPKYLVSALDPREFRRPVGFGVLEGTAWLQLGAFVLAAELAADGALRDLLERRADAVFAPWRFASWVGSHPWFQLYLDRRSSR
jgi:hypothetical protein